MNVIMKWICFFALHSNRNFPSVQTLLQFIIFLLWEDQSEKWLQTWGKEKHDDWEENIVSEVWRRQRNRGSVSVSVCGGEAKWDAADWRTAEALMRYAGLHPVHYWLNVQAHMI